MQKVIVKRYVYAAGMFVLITIAGLWAWNTLSELFGGPQAQYRHVLELAPEKIDMIFTRDTSATQSDFGGLTVSCSSFRCSVWAAWMARRSTSFHQARSASTRRPARPRART